MKNIQRKPKPSVPSWYWLDGDDCQWCNGKDKHGCGLCKFLRKFKRDYKDKKEKEKSNYDKQLYECSEE